MLSIQILTFLFGYLLVAYLMALCLTVLQTYGQYM
jgi:hypothetical protein